jgi:leader peptidase (prepilin peptidase)/N-methyltransferase
MIRIFATVFAALVGLAFGSFLNVCVTRWPAGESVIKPRSHCRSCARTLAWWENIPVISWLALRGRCRTCGTSISWRYPLVELAVGTLWAIAAWRDQASFSLIYCAGLMVLTWLLIALAVLDAEHLWLPNFLTLSGVVVGYLWFFSQISMVSYGLHDTSGPWKEAGKRLLAIVVAAGLILFIRWTYWLVRRHEGIGLGDAKLMAMLAAWLGLPGALLSFVIGVVLATIAALALLALPAARRGSDSWSTTKLPLGTFLCSGGIVSALWGRQIIAAYLRWSGF